MNGTATYICFFNDSHARLILHELKLALHLNGLNEPDEHRRASKAVQPLAGPDVETIPRKLAQRWVVRM